MTASTITLGALSKGECLDILRARNTPAALAGLRTPFMLNDAMQEEFYRTVVSNRYSPHRYWAIRRAQFCVGMGGVTNLQWENGLGEISLILHPEFQGEGIGKSAVALLLTEAFDRMRLLTVVGECYRSNPALDFWLSMIKAYGGTHVDLPRRKWWDGRLWDALFFTFTVEAWRESRVQESSDVPSQ